MGAVEAALPTMNRRVEHRQLPFTPYSRSRSALRWPRSTNAMMRFTVTRSGSAR